ncbi:hypothetical protein BO71DRAFT_398185 [Aspergillus ellipticus CBS 707.79]|uniref:Uncharacterized protein n=1 Tax=Aspergillus ellipticus CBS 707.79 TaxID=1448320 RepID=A0A319DDB1_9EURO|nr:hypothetical protein BO71DRAFT_398185 [Aspergillus ellipticus CBS 707.79]
MPPVPRHIWCNRGGGSAPLSGPLFLGSASQPGLSMTMQAGKQASSHTPQCDDVAMLSCAGEIRFGSVRFDAQAFVET